MSRQGFTMEEISAMIYEEIENTDTEEIQAIYVPPSVDELTDNEDIDENNTDEMSPMHNITGTIELHVCHLEMKASDADIMDEQLHNRASKRHQLQIAQPIWKRKMEACYDRLPAIDIEALNVEQMIQSLGRKSPLELFSMFFDEQVISDIVYYSNKYAVQKNEYNFKMDIADLKRFIGILIFSGYHSLPQMDAYWSNIEDRGIQIVKDTMSLSKFRMIKKYIHLSDNKDLDKSDKFSKVSPIFNLMNEKFQQFGIFTKHLSICEQMVPYFGRHSCKMFIKGKPVRFGFKYWCICSSDGYLYKFIPYAGKSTKDYVGKEKIGLETQVVINLMSVVTKPNEHQIYFDHFFTNYDLMVRLNKMGIYATGTIRDNRTNQCPLMDIKQMKKTEKGTFDYVFDEKNKISMCRWNDNAVVTVATNNCTVFPLASVKRFNRKTKEMKNIDQPNMIREYNSYMGGVDLHDNAIENYRIKIRDKKWWWPLFTNLIGSALVNAWKIQQLFQEKPLSQFEFRSDVALCLMKFEDTNPLVCQLGRPIKLGRPTASSSVPHKVRTDFGHLIQRTDFRRRCKKCSSNSIYICKTCQVTLHPDCFEYYHQ